MRHIDNWFDLTSVAEGREVVVLALPWGESASGRGGAAEGPRAIRDWSRTEQAIDERGAAITGIRVIDRGEHGSGHAAMRVAVDEALREHPGAFLLGIGGDHSVSQPVIAAVADRFPELGLLWLDAHADLFVSYEGDVTSHACTVARAWEAGVAPEATAMVGLRSFSHDEAAALDRVGLRIPAADWLQGGSGSVADRIVSTLAGRPVYLSLDIDVLDPAAAPGTGYPVAGGPSNRELLDLLEAVWPRLDIVAADLVEVAPALDPSGITAANAAHVLLQMLAHVARAGSGGGPLK